RRRVTRGSNSILSSSFTVNTFRVVGTVSIEKVHEGFVSVFKDAIEVRSDQKFLYQPSSARTVLHAIAHECAAALIPEGMLMAPRPVGALSLLIDKACRRFPNADLALPSDGHTPNLQS